LVPWQLVFTQKFDNIEQAKEVERALKKFKRKDIIERIIQEGFIRKEILGGV
jgi:predicted GIY-YIG superfamily endonuclease